MKSAAVGSATGVLEQARHKTKGDIELLIAKMKPQSPVASIFRKLPDPKPAQEPI